MKCDVCSEVMEIEDLIPLSTAQKFKQEPFEYFALICETCVEDYFELEFTF
jgi:hypothetical protein